MIEYTKKIFLKMIEDTDIVLSSGEAGAIPEHRGNCLKKSF